MFQIPSVLKSWNKNVVLGIVMLVAIMFFVNKFYAPTQESFCDQPQSCKPNHYGPWGPHQLNVQEYGDFGFTKDALTEGFVPWNSEDVGNYQVSLVRLDQESQRALFNSLAKEDKGKVDTSFLTPFRDQPHGRDQARAYINHVLARINRASDRKYHILDIQSTNKQAAMDTRSNELVERWTAELFIQEKDSRKVHAHGTNIGMEFFVKGPTVQIAKLYFITDNFYQRPLVGGQNVHKKHYRIKNPFHLTQPFFTSEDKVLPDTNESDEILVNHHKDLRTPQYRCFQESGESKAGSEASCDVASGYWDKPVERDEECPFFRANKHYPNRLGGVNPNTKKCEMPIGTKTIGYRFISNDPQHKPWCYGCIEGSQGPGSWGPCCEEQRNVELYPHLGGIPDIAMPGDSIERGNNWKLLQERGINWRAHPTNIRSITNPSQKAPVFTSFIGPGPGKL
jgi:hypothetical protein